MTKDANLTGKSSSYEGRRSSQFEQSKARFLGTFEFTQVLDSAGAWRHLAH